MCLDLLGNLYGCPDCDAMGLTLYASCLQMHCLTCGWIYEFDISAQSGSAYDANVHLIYAMRYIGQGFAGARRFCGLMAKSSKT